MKSRLFLAAALPAALLLCNTQATEASPASPARATHNHGGDEAYIVIRYRDQAELQRVAARFQHLDVDKRARTAKVEADAEQVERPVVAEAEVPAQPVTPVAAVVARAEPVAAN